MNKSPDHKLIQPGGILRDINGKLNRLSWRTKVISIFVVIMAVFIFRAGFSTRYYMVEKNGQKMVSNGLKVADRYLSNHTTQFHYSVGTLANEASRTAVNPGTFINLFHQAEAWHGSFRPDIFCYINIGGNLLYSINNTYTGAERTAVIQELKSLTPVQQALGGITSGGLAVIPREFLAAENLLNKARIITVSTPNAAPAGNRLEERGLAIVSAWPIYINGRVTGVLMSAQLLNNNFYIVDSIANDINVNSTIFLDNIRVSTNIRDQKDNRAIGTIISKPVEEEVLKKGVPYYGRAFVVNDWYITAYEPLKDLNRKVIGALYVGIKEAPLVAAQKSLNNDLMFTLFILTVIFMLALFWLYRSIVVPVRKMSATALRFAKGDLDARILTTNSNKCWEIIGCRDSSCPVYGNRYLKCWLMPQASCTGAQYGLARKKTCIRCEVYRVLAGDELEHLADAFNFMAASMQEYTESLQNLNNELEEKNNKLQDQKDELECQTEQLMALNVELEETVRALDDSQSIIYALAVAVEAKDPYTRGHSERVADYSTKLAAAYGLPADKFEIIRGAALLHDIGKIGISGSILRKPNTLTVFEFQQVKKHPAIGERICSSLKFAREMLPIIRHHHEHFDGMGYPDGLKGEKIPLLARVVAIADAFDAMTSDRPYRSGMSAKEALDVLADGAGSQWDPELIDIFVDLMRRELAVKGRLNRDNFNPQL